MTDAEIIADLRHQIAALELTDSVRIAELQAQIARMQSASLANQLDALKSARASGVEECWLGERKVQYKSDREMVAAISALENEIAKETGVTHTIRVHEKNRPREGPAFLTVAAIAERNSAQPTLADRSSRTLPNPTLGRYPQFRRCFREGE
jgi:hypothetical protein